MTMKRVDPGVEVGAMPVLDMANLPNDLAPSVKFSSPTDEDMASVAALRSSSEPWKSRGETVEESLKALTALRPFIHVAKVQNQVVGYVTVERDGPAFGLFLHVAALDADARRDPSTRHDVPDPNREQL